MTNQIPPECLHYGSCQNCPHYHHPICYNNTTQKTKTNNMNIANQTLAAIKNRKALLTKEKNEAIEYITNKYNKDMAELEKEEKQILKTFHDIPEETYKEKED